MYYLGQACGIAGTVLTILTPQFRRKTQILACNALVNGLNALNFLLIGQLGSAAFLCLPLPCDDLPVHGFYWPRKTGDCGIIAGNGAFLSAVCGIWFLRYDFDSRLCLGDEPAEPGRAAACDWCADAFGFCQGTPENAAVSASQCRRVDGLFWDHRRGCGFLLCSICHFRVGCIMEISEEVLSTSSFMFPAAP